MPPVPITADQFPKALYGIHDLEGATFLSQNHCSGWLLHTVKVDDEPPADYTSLVNQGFRIIVRLNNNYGSTGGGTIPLPAQYDTFAAQCAGWVAGSKGARIWLIGNEPNHPAEYPSGQAITPQSFASCYLKTRDAIHRVSGHSGDQVIPGAVAPWNAAQGDWVQYFASLCKLIRGNCDGLALHTYTHGNTADRIADEATFTQPFEHLHYNFRTYRDFLNAVPADMRSLPVYITETQTVIDAGPAWTHQNTGWAQAAYAEINAWNAVKTNQSIQALILFRWKAEGRPEWSFAGFPEVLADFQAAVAKNYAVTLPRVLNPLAPTLEQTALAAAKTVNWMPVNNQAALWKYAQAHGLQDQQTDELVCTYNGEKYIVQVFNKGIVYVKFGDWANVRVIPK